MSRGSRNIRNRKCNIFSIVIFAVLLPLLASSSGMAGENCSMLNGTCRDACAQNEEAQLGAFEDCGEKQGVLPG